MPHTRSFLSVLVATVALMTADSRPALPGGAETTDDPAAVVRSFHEALSTGNREVVLTLLDTAAVIFEQGGAEMSREEYASHHLEGDLKFSRATTRKILDQRSGRAGETAWVLTRSETGGSFNGLDVSSRTAETMVLQKSGEAWRIVHIHWSSRRLGEQKP